MKYLINNLNTDWRDIINDEFLKDYLLEIDKKLFDSNKIIFPKKDNIFNAFNFFNINDTKVVIFGQDPYHNDNQANGLSFSVYEDIKTPPSLKNLFKELEIETGIKRKNSDLSDWAKQGILLMNTTLTVFKNEPNSHSKWGWIEFTKNIIEVLNTKTTNIVFLLLGNNAKQLKKYIDKDKHFIIEHIHPSPLSVRFGFYNSNFYVKINEFLKKNNITPIEW